MALVLAVAGGVAYLTGNQTGPVVVVDVNPGAAILTGVGETRQLQALAVDGSGRRVDGGAITWSSSHPDVVRVDSNGVLTAVAEGSTQVVAKSGGRASPPILVVVAQPAAGVTLVADDQVVLDVAPAELDAEPSFDNLLTVTLKGAAPAVGARLLGTGEREIAGEVVATAPDANGTRVTFKLVPLRELLPNLVVDEQFELVDADVHIPDDIARLYDVKRSGTSLTFTPKPNFEELVASGTEPTSTWHGPLRDGDLTAAIDPPSGTTAEVELGPFQCEYTQSTLPIQLANAPAISIEVNPILDLDWANGSLRRFVVGGEAKASVAGGFKVTAAFEGKLTCGRDFYTITLPIGGALAYFIGGQVPVGGAFEFAGKVTLASLELGTKVEASAAFELGLDCPAAACAFKGTTRTSNPVVTPTIDGPSLGDLRVEPSFTASATVKLQLGSSVWSALRWKFVEAKIGAKFAPSWAPTRVQILDAAYKSDYKLTLEAGAGLNSDSLGDIAALFGLPSLAVAEVKSSLDLARSPVGSLSTDKARYQPGEAVTAKVTLDEEWLDFSWVYQVARIRVVHYANGVETEVGAQDATAGQKDFEISFAAPGTMAATELYAFVTTRFPPLDFFSLELDRKTSDNRIVFASDRNALDAGFTDIWTANGDGTGLKQLTFDPGHEFWPTWSPDGTKIAYTREGSIWMMNADGTDQRQLVTLKGAGAHVAWSADGQRLAFIDRTGDDEILGLFVVDADGGGRRLVTTSGVYSPAWPTWSADGATIVFGGLDAAVGSYRIYAVPAGGGTATRLADAGMSPAYSPDGKRIAYLNGQRQVTIINADGSGATLLPIFGAARVAWSPDGARLIVDAGSGDLEILSFNLDGSGVQTYEDGLGNDWMPDW